MVFRIVKTEFYRDLHNSLSTIFFSLILGFILSFGLTLSSYLSRIFESPHWSVDMLILPKGITPEIAVSNFVKGSPDGLIPLALYNTLSIQIQNAPGSLKILGFLPYLNAEEKPEIAVTDPDLKDFAQLKQSAVWSHYSLTDLNLKRAELSSRENYRTPEWGDQVLMGVMATGSTQELTSLKNLIDRKTIAQAFFVGAENNDTYNKLTQLKRGLFLIMLFIFVSSLLGFWLALKNMNQKRSSIELVLKELKYNKTLLLKIKSIQLFMTIVFPILIGFMLSKFGFVLVQSFIFNL